MGYLKKTLKRWLTKSSFCNDYFRIVDNKIPVTFKQFIFFKVFNKNKRVYWPVHKNSIVYGNVTVGINSSVGATPGCYIQGIGEIVIGNYTLLAPNVGIISSNHAMSDYRKHKKSKVIIGNYCWIGMNSVILPGVILGDHTIVGAGAVVTKSFEEGSCIIGGNPARVIRKLSKEEIIDYRDEHEFYGFIPKEKFEEYKQRNVTVTN